MLQKDYLRIIDSIADATCVNARFLKAVRMGIHSLSPEIHRLGRLEFVLSDKTYKYSYCHKGDLERILNAINEAKNKGASIIIISIHSHDIKGMSDDTADYYLKNSHINVLIQELQLLLELEHIS